MTNAIVSGLLQTLDVQILRLIHSIDKCIAHLVETWEDGTHFSNYATQSRQLIDKQIRQKQGYFGRRDSTRHNVNTSQSLLSLLLKILRWLAESKIRLDRHREDVDNANAALSLSHSLSDMSGINQLLAMLQDVLTGLSNVSGRPALAQARHRGGFEKEMK